MKRAFVLIVLVLCASLATAQEYVEIVPVISSTAVQNCTTAVASATITTKTSDTAFASIIAGQAVYGVGVPYGTTVSYSNSVDSLVLSAAITQGGTKTLQFGVFDGTDYSTGDWFGLPFKVTETSGNLYRILESIQITDNADMIDDLDVVFFDEFSDTLGLDNAAASIVASEASKVCGGIALTGETDIGSVRSIQGSNIGLVVPRKGLYARMIARATIDPTAVNNLRIRFGFR